MSVSIAVNNTPATPPQKQFQVCAWDIGDETPTVIAGAVYKEAEAHAMAKNILLYQAAQRTGVREVAGPDPWVRMYALRGGEVVEDEVE